MNVRHSAWLGGATLSLLLWGPGFPATAQNQPLVMQGLPNNAPTIPTLGGTPSSLPPANDGWIYPTAAPQSAIQSSAITGEPVNPARYRVEVPGMDPMLLATVQMVEPQAFVRTQAQAIQVGSFATEDNARQRVQDLAQRGVMARVVPLGTVSQPPVTRWEPGTSSLVANNNSDLMMPPASPRTVDFSAPSAVPMPPAAPETLNWPAPPLATPVLKDYVVVIPAPKDVLGSMVQKIQQVGYTGAIQMQPTSRLGSFVAAGGFAQRSDAEYWNKQFRSMGFDARVVFFR